MSTLPDLRLVAGEFDTNVGVFSVINFTLLSHVFIFIIGSLREFVNADSIFISYVMSSFSSLVR